MCTAGYRSSSIKAGDSKQASLNSAAGDDALDVAEGLAPKRGMVLPFTPLAMSFDNVSYFVDMPPVTESILKSALAHLEVMVTALVDSVH